MDRADLELVVAIARTGSLTGASRQLHIAQPALSRRLAHLERSVGAPLFVRGRHGATPTPPGRVLIERAEAALAALTQAEQDTADAAAGRAGRLRVGTTPTLGAELLPPALAAFRHAHPGVRLDLTASGNSPHLQAAVSNGDLDVALTAYPPEPGAGARVIARGHQRFVLIAPAELGFTNGARLARRVLSEVPVVALAEGEGLRLLLDQLYVELDFTPGIGPDIAIETTEREMLVPFVAAGLGVSLVPEDFAHQRAVDGLTVHPLSPQVTRGVAVVVADGPLPASVEAFVQLLGLTRERRARVPRTRRQPRRAARQ